MDWFPPTSLLCPPSVINLGNKYGGNAVWPPFVRGSVPRFCTSRKIYLIVMFNSKIRLNILSIPNQDFLYLNYCINCFEVSLGQDFV